MGNTQQVGWLLAGMLWDLDSAVHSRPPGFIQKLSFVSIPQDIRKKVHFWLKTFSDNK